MTQQEQGHPTTEQLSAFLDKQLTPQEQAFFDAHLQSCPRCQGVLGELRRTVALLHAMPQPQLPRSFTLPAGISHTQVARPQPVRRVPRYALQRSVRVISALAAAIAVLFILSALVPLTGAHLTSGGTASSTSAPAAGTSNGTAHSPASKPNSTVAPQTTGKPTPSATSKSARTVIGSPTNSLTLPPFLDVSQPVWRLTLGALLLLLGIAGIIATRRRRDIAT